MVERSQEDMETVVRPTEETGAQRPSRGHRLFAIASASQRAAQIDQLDIETRIENTRRRENLRRHDEALALESIDHDAVHLDDPGRGPQPGKESQQDERAHQGSPGRAPARHLSATPAATPAARPPATPAAAPLAGGFARRRLASGLLALRACGSLVHPGPQFPTSPPGVQHTTPKRRLAAR